MIKFCLEQWIKNKQRLEEAIRNSTNLNDCDYKHLVELIIEYVLNEEYETFDKEGITVIDNGGYCGTLLFLIPSETYEPSEDDYLMTFVNYGSCSGCDTLLSIQRYNDDGKLDEAQVRDFMTLCKDLITNMIKPYNTGWRHKEKFETVNFESEDK